MLDEAIQRDLEQAKVAFRWQRRENVSQLPVHPAHRPVKARAQLRKAAVVVGQAPDLDRHDPLDLRRHCVPDELLCIGAQTAVQVLKVIAKILAHLDKTAPDQYLPELPLGARAPPSQASLL